MQELAKILIVDDNSEFQKKIKIILDFIGEQYYIVNSESLAENLLNYQWSSCLIGNISESCELQKIVTLLENSANIPIIACATYNEPLKQLNNYMGCFEQPLNYKELSELFVSCHDFYARQNYDICVNNCIKKSQFKNLVGKSDVLLDIKHLISQVAVTEANVLILGDSGTGKEVVARNIHTLSDRKDGSFVPINCGAIPPDLLESELFGHEKGAFTGAISTRKGRFELAKGGTLFLDEIGDMPLAMQVKLLRVIQERKFERVGGSKQISANVRIIAATHRNLEQMIESGDFREDLFYRLNVFPIEVPPLSKRKEDIPLLLDDVLLQLEEAGAPSISFNSRSISALCEYLWPGNIRELRNLVERLIILYPNEMIDIEHLPKQYCGEFSGNLDDEYKNQEPPFTPFVDDSSASSELDWAESSALQDMFQYSEVETESDLLPNSLPLDGLDLKATVAAFEVEMIKQALEVQTGIVARAAEMLGMRRTTLVEKMKKYEISRDDIIASAD